MRKDKTFNLFYLQLITKHTLQALFLLNKHSITTTKYITKKGQQNLYLNNIPSTKLFQCCDHIFLITIFVCSFLLQIKHPFCVDRSTRLSKQVTLQFAFKITRVVCPNFGHHALTLSLTKYTFLQQL